MFYIVVVFFYLQYELYSIKCYVCGVADLYYVCIKVAFNEFR